MKRFFILSLLLTLSLAAFPQAAEQVVRSYISTLNDFLLSPNTFSKRSAFENSLQNCLIQDGIYIKYKGNVSIDDCKGSDYAGIISDAINDNQRYSYAKVEIARSLQTTGSGSCYEVTAYLHYSGAIEMRTVTVFHINNGKISAMTNDYIKTKEWNAGDPPEPTVPFTITSCTVINTDYDGNTLPLDASHTQYLKPEIRYNCNTSGSYDIYVKFYDASGGMKSESWSPSGYTQVNNVTMSSGSGSKNLKGYGGTDSGYWRAGNYRYEFYYNGTLLYTHRFSVPEGQQQPTQQPSSSTTLPITVRGTTYGNMILVKGGTFSMGATYEQGSDAYSDEKPVHTVALSNYYIGETEVTCGLWKAVMGGDPSYFKKGDNYPVENVSWNDIQDFLTKLNSMTGKTYRLPTEAEWEYAARGGSKRRGYKYSGGSDINSVAVYDKNSYYLGSSNSNYGTHPVKSKSPNELGLYDMSGNVWEWCSDWYKFDYYANSPSTNPQGPSPLPYRVLRGGSWISSAGDCRVSRRYGYYPSDRNDRSGFRLALVP